MSRTFTNISVPFDLHAKVKGVKDEYGTKLDRVLAAWGKAWDMLTPEQRVEAIRQTAPSISNQDRRPQPTCAA